MNIKRPLVNPIPRDVDAKIKDSNEQAEYKSKDQLSFAVDNRKIKSKQQISTIKHKLKRRLEFIEVSQLWRNPGVSFMIVTGVFNTLTLLIGGILVFSKLPPKLQLLYDPIEETWFRDQDKSIVIIMPIFLAGLTVIQFKLISTVFKGDRRLGITLSWLLTFLNVFLLIAISQIYRLNI